MLHVSKDDLLPCPITTASFQAARQAKHLSPSQRRANRAALRSIGWPPGLVANRWLTAEAFAFRSKIGMPDARFTVPQGFAFDGASVPWVLTAFVPRSHSDLLAAAALHDWLYVHAHRWVSREKADAVFREALQVLGLHWVWAMLMWRAVRVGGWVPWYARKPKSPVARFLGLRWVLRAPLSAAFMFAAFLIGGARDFSRLAEFRREGRAICASDN